MINTSRQEYHGSQDTDVIERPFVRRPEEMQRYIDKLKEDGYELDRLDELVKVTDEKEGLIKSLKAYDPSLNGDTDNLLEDLALYRQEALAKKKWTLWEYVKSVPERVWGTIKAHPYLATGIVVTLGGIAAMYYTGAGSVVIGRLRDWLTSYMAANSLSGAAEAAKDVAGQAAETVRDAGAAAKEGISGALEGISIPSAPVSAPTLPSGSIPLPTTAPSLEEADMILRGLEMGG